MEDVSRRTGPSRLPLTQHDRKFQLPGPLASRPSAPRRAAESIAGTTGRLLSFGRRVSPWSGLVASHRRSPTAAPSPARHGSSVLTRQRQKKEAAGRIQRPLLFWLPERVCIDNFSGGPEQGCSANF